MKRKDKPVEQDKPEVKPKNPGGRPEDYNLQIAEEFCSRIAMGHSMHTICNMDDMPARPTVFRWLSKHEEFRDHYTRAKVEGAHADADKIESIAEKVLSGEYDPNAARVAIDAYKWTAARKMPKKYGDSTKIEHTGQIEYKNLSDEEIEARLNALMSNKNDQ
jgi:hypothetical protein